MKRMYTLFILFLSLGMMAQTAPDFTVTDTHGKEHKLYEDYLDQGKTVVLDLFFVDCPPCNTLAPLLEPLYQEYGAGTGDVEFISLTSEPTDSDAKVLAFEEQHGTTWPAISGDGGGPEAQAPYTDNSWGQFLGYPTLIVIAPDGSVQFDAWVDGDYPATIELLDEWIGNTGAMRPVSNVSDLQNVSSFSITPNPVANTAQLTLNLESEAQTSIAIYNTLGQQVKNIYTGSLSAGLQSIDMNTTELISGTYFIKVTMKGDSKMEQFIKI